MLRAATVRNFKSFEEATLYLSPLTLLIGPNASGKSNGIEALQLLAWLASGRRLGDLLASIREQELSIRGNLTDFTFQGRDITLGCEVEREGLSRLVLSITLGIREEGLRILAESLSGDGPVPLYEVAEPAPSYGNQIKIAYNNFKRGGKKPHVPGIDQQAVFTQLATPARFAAGDTRSQQEIPAAAEAVRQALQEILFLDPNPRVMRDYSFLQEKTLRGDGASLSAVLFHLCEDGDLKSQVLDFIRSLPEQDIQDISFLSTPRNEVMVQLHESFGGGPKPREAALLSDGTLRVLAVAAALLSVPRGSTVVIEEIDNGVHPSRAERLLANIRRVANERRLAVLLTTHNPALLDAIPPESIPDTLACYRDPERGDSRIVRLSDLESYPELVAQGPVGRLVTKGILDRVLKAPPLAGEAKVEHGLAWLADFRNRASS
jgi:predicted ATPase